MKCFSVSDKCDVERVLREVLSKEGYSHYRVKRFGRIIEYRLGLFNKIRLIHYSSDNSIEVCCTDNRVYNRLYSYLKPYSKPMDFRRNASMKTDTNPIDQLAGLVIERNILLSKVSDSRRDLVITSIVSIVFLTICTVLGLPVNLIGFILLVLAIPMLLIGFKNRQYLNQPELQYTPILYFRYRKKLAIIEEDIERLMTLIPSSCREKEVLRQILRE